jgi:hypothetical protein
VSDLAIRTYDTMVWRLDIPRGLVNFPNSHNVAEVDFLTQF